MKQRRARRTFMDAEGNVVKAGDPAAVVCIEHEVDTKGRVIVERTYVVAAVDEKNALMDLVAFTDENEKEG